MTDIYEGLDPEARKEAEKYEEDLKKKTVENLS